MKPFSDVVPDTARTDEGLITTHRAGDDLYLGIPDSLTGREILMVSRVSKTQADLFRVGGGGKKVNSQVLRWQRRGDELLLRVASYEKTADSDDPVYQSVQNSSFEPILKAFEIKSPNKDSTGVLINATELFTSDVKALGLPKDMRQRYGARRLDGGAATSAARRAFRRTPT
ncbi:DUF5117 domain-containing protein [Salinibacter ruber]|uniref:DUF5117 domain-containing protein n=1 Tax=Salinibacter ruber TaxID=146919 RepID=UPI00182AD6F6|nr:DUF5117 domain-containing protein [Salinibacter ruber]MBB4091299.1 hypothetical protein [Salinibacter ruber]